MAAQKHLVKSVMSRCSLFIFVMHIVNIHNSLIQWSNDTFTDLYKQSSGQHKNKAGLTHAPVYYPFASTHMVNTTHTMSKKCAYKISQIFLRVFWIRVRWILREIHEKYKCTSNITTFTVFDAPKVLIITRFHCIKEIF